MKDIRGMALVALLAALVAFIAGRFGLEQQVNQIVERREIAYCGRLLKKLNESRALMGMPPANARNFAEILESYFEGMASVMQLGVEGPNLDKKVK